MKKSFRIFPFLLVVILLLPGCQKFQQDEFGGYKKSVLLDSDMVEAFDDGVAFMMLLGSDDIEIKGLTTVTGNVWAQAFTPFSMSTMSDIAEKVWTAASRQGRV